tara:strand:- start:48167 stop:48610 length:444 start_codon:yes stop_codon:yes gene_type:complete
LKAIVQRVSQASVSVSGTLVGSINKGLLVFLGVSQNDTEQECKKIVSKILNMRVFPGDKGNFCESIQDIQGSILLVSQFTLYGDTTKGTRPGFSKAASPEKANELYEKSIELFKQTGLKTETGKFGADMDVQLNNDGPITLILDTDI